MGDEEMWTWGYYYYDGGYADYDDYYYDDDYADDDGYYLACEKHRFRSISIFALECKV